MALQRPVDAIHVGSRHRTDMGDLDALATSIDTLGLLQPITISPDGTLICGARRLAAVKQLGHTHVDVWVHAGISTPIQRLLAQRDDHATHKALSPTEAAALYRELKLVLAEDGRRRQGDSRRAAPPGGRSAESAERAGETSRAAAARLVTGSNAYSRLEQIGELQRLVEANDLPEEVRTQAVAALQAIDGGDKVNGHYQRVRDRLARLGHTSPSDTRADRAGRAATDLANSPSRARASCRRFQLLWADLAGWTDRFDPALIGSTLNDEQWAAFEATVSATVGFLHTARRSRPNSASADPGHPAEGRAPGTEAAA
jgi:ParB family chromosome partitioning protein